MVGVVRIAAADRDRPDADIAIIDMPAILASIGRWAAGESGHAALKRGLSGSALVSAPVVSRGVRGRISGMPLGESRAVAGAGLVCGSRECAWLDSGPIVPPA